MRLTTGPPDARHTLILAHGAGGAMNTPFLNDVAQSLAGYGIRVVRFEFPYMAARREGRKSGAPDRQPVLLDAWRGIIDEFLGVPRSSSGSLESQHEELRGTPRNRGTHLFIGGKSLGGRMASMVADEAGVRGLVCFGYPFHPPGKPQQLRTAHLETLRTPTLILQGTRDPFGTEEEVRGYRLSPGIRVEWLPDGDHSLKPRVASGTTLAANITRAVDLTAAFITHI